jgi:hypothetical protein
MDTAPTQCAPLVAPVENRTLDADRKAGGSSDASAAASTGPLSGDTYSSLGALAFQALLVPVPAPGAQRAGEGPGEADDASKGAQAPLETGGDGHYDFRSTQDTDPGLADAIPSGLAGRASQSGQAAHGLFMAAPVSSNPGFGTAATPQGANAHHAASPSPPDLSAWEAAEMAAKPAAGGAAREIQLELRDDDARVNVRLVERAGSVQVEVRTPDTHLAGSLRDDLPALSARLEQTGLRTEAWHDAPAAAAARIKMADPTSSAGFQSSQNNSQREGGGRGARDGQPQEKRRNQNQPESKEFSWHYTSLQ